MPVADPEAHRPPDERARTPADWPELFDVRIWLTREVDPDGIARWHALAADFDVAGMGDSPRNAVRDMANLLNDYLEACAIDHAPFAQVRRPLPVREQLLLRARALATPLLRLLHRPPVANERTLLLPPDQRRPQAC